ncbi:hypothetical protein OAN22_00725 [Alphaproteobacteria bacterium]|nr:hypothetical protein [Alphaproteobacteria bacterium]
MDKTDRDIENFTTYLKSGYFSDKPYSIASWEEQLFCFKNSVCKDKVDFGSTLHGYVYYEIIPILTVAKSIGMDCQVHFLGPEQNEKDGLLFHKSLDIKGQGVQCVTVIDGKQEKLRIEKLEKYGLAKAGKVSSQSPENCANIPPELRLRASALDTPAHEHAFRHLLLETLQKKIDIRYKGLWLIVTLTNFGTLALQKHSLSIIKKIFHQLLDEEDLREKLGDIYDKVFLVDGHKDQIVESLVFTGRD